jgi:hypothetical protein
LKLSFQKTFTPVVNAQEIAVPWVAGPAVLP